MIKFEEGVFRGSWRKPKYAGDREITAIVVKDSYGSLKQQHTFTLRILSCEGYGALAAGTVITRKGRNVYRKGTMRKRWDDENARKQAQDKKHARGDIAREKRRQRQELDDMFQR